MNNGVFAPTGHHSILLASISRCLLRRACSMRLFKKRESPVRQSFLCTVKQKLTLAIPNHHRTNQNDPNQQQLHHRLSSIAHLDQLNIFSSSPHDNHHLSPLRNLPRCVPLQLRQGQHSAPGPDTPSLRAPPPRLPPPASPVSQLPTSPRGERPLPSQLLAVSKVLSAKQTSPAMTRTRSPALRTMPPRTQRSRTVCFSTSQPDRWVC